MTNSAFTHLHLHSHMSQLGETSSLHPHHNSTILCYIGIQYHYEPIAFKLLDGEKTIHYKPDLLVGSGIFIEVKGWWNEKSLRIKRLMEEQHPNTSIVYVEEDLYRKIEGKVATKIPGWELGGKKEHSVATMVIGKMEPQIEYRRAQLSELTGLPPGIVSSALQSLKMAGLVTRDIRRRGTWKIKGKEVAYEDAE